MTRLDCSSAVDFKATVCYSDLLNTKGSASETRQVIKISVSL